MREVVDRPGDGDGFPRRSMPARSPDRQPRPGVANRDPAIGDIERFAHRASDGAIRGRQPQRPVEGEGILERAADFVEHLAYATKARFVGARVHRKGRCQLQAVDVIVRETIGASAGEADHAHQLAVGVDRADRAREDAARPAPDGPGPASGAAIDHQELARRIGKLPDRHRTEKGPGDPGHDHGLASVAPGQPSHVGNGPLEDRAYEDFIGRARAGRIALSDIPRHAFGRVARCRFGLWPGKGWRYCHG